MTSGNGRGRDALFGAPRLHEPAAVTGGSGRQALFSAPPRRRGCVVVECERCQSRTPVPFVDLWTLLPSVWIPVRRFSRLMRCPACHAFAWGRIEWRTLLTG